MPVGGRTTNTMTEMLTNMLRDLSVAKTLPDADLEFLVELETQILMKLRQPLEQAMNQSLPTGGSPMPPEQQPNLPPLMPMAPPAETPVPPPGQTVPGLRQQPPMPSPDELARLLPG